MSEKIVVGPINRGLKNDRTAFVINNDSFPTLINAYQWRGRVKRKRGTSFLTRLNRFFDSNDVSYNTGTATITLNGSGEGNLLDNASWTLETNSNIVPGTVTITAPGPTVYTDVNEDGTLDPSGTINYANGDFVILAEAGNAVTVSFFYYPSLPVMGLEDFEVSSDQFPGTIAFDTTYAYNIVTAFPYPNYSVSFYKNPAVSPSLPGYVPKTNSTPVSWNGFDYQQFWSTNYQRALWVTNGIDVPFTGANLSMQFNTITAIAINAAGPPASATITTATNHGLVIGDFVFINEVVGITGINWQTGYVTAVPALNQITVTFPNATLGGAWVSGGIVQYLTSRSDPTTDCIRFYDGDPTDGNIVSPSLTGTQGWVNFCPPLSQADFSIADAPEAVYYLIGARTILSYKDRLLFFGPVIQTSEAGSQIYLQDTVIYSQNGTPYYTASYTNSPNPAIDTPTSITNVYNPILLPENQTSTPNAWFEDQTGFGGFISAGISQPIITTANNGDVIICGFDVTQARLVYTGNDIVPFNFFLIDSELGSSSTFSVINMGRSILSRGSRGYVSTSQERTDRIDLDIPDQVFQIRLTDNGTERMCAQRDYINEWIYFTYTSNDGVDRFPNQTLLYNYRDESWAIFNESYTHHGQFRKQTGFTWQTVGLVYPSWYVWNDPWNAGTSTLLQPDVISGNQQGFIVTRGTGTGESPSIYIQSISGSTIRSPNHNLSTGDYILINDALGTIGTEINGKVFSILVSDEDSFILNPTIDSGTYLGEGLITKIYVPYVQTKQFPVAWDMARKTRLGPQQYLLSTTDRSQITLLIFLSQNGASAYNNPEFPFAVQIVPSATSQNNSLIYSTVLYTCPESTNLGLTPANTNLQMVTAQQQSQIWHRVNTSLLGDTVQLGFTLSDAQIRDLDTVGSPFEITGISQATQAVIDTTGQFQSGQLIEINDVEGMTELNGNVYQVVSSTATQVTINVDSSAFTPYTDGGTATAVAGINAFSEIVLHGFIIDVSPSMVLA